MGQGGTALKNWSFGSSFLVSCCPGPERRWRNSSTLQASKDALSPNNLVLLECKRVPSGGVGLHVHPSKGHFKLS